MTVTNRVLMVLGMLGAIMLAGVPGIAQEKPADNMQLVLEKIRANKKLLVAENMPIGNPSWLESPMGKPL